MIMERRVPIMNLKARTQNLFALGRRGVYIKIFVRKRVICRTASNIRNNNNVMIADD